MGGVLQQLRSNVGGALEKSKIKTKMALSYLGRGVRSTEPKQKRLQPVILAVHKGIILGEIAICTVCDNVHPGHSKNNASYLLFM